MRTHRADAARRHQPLCHAVRSSVFSRILPERPKRSGSPTHSPSGPSDCKNLLKTIVQELNLPDRKYKPNVLSSRISNLQNCLVTPGAYHQPIRASRGPAGPDPEFGNIYNIYCQRCKRNGAMNFDDLLLRTNAPC